ncbi:phosphatidate cytidylyltransferase [Ruminiclostridium sufflavum]|nr:phosphatidate cytidylyltransferase [Ruminiclostridium sufflavum]
MLKTRVISAVAGLALLIAVLYLGSVSIGIAISLIAAIGLYEFYNAASNIKNINPIKSAGYLSVIPLLILGIEKTGLFRVDVSILLGISVCLIIFLSMSFIVLNHNRYNIIDACVTAFGIAYVPFLMSFLILVRNMEQGGYLIWLIFIGAWGTDTMAYTCGRLFGKRKIIPEISPKKTYAGAIGGIIGCILLMIAFGAVCSNSFDLKIPYAVLALLGFCCGIISQIGDWAASAIKRYVNVKDFGNIMPGHGGVLDRFDSILFVAPVVYYIILLLK